MLWLQRLEPQFLELSGTFLVSDAHSGNRTSHVCIVYWNSHADTFSTCSVLLEKIVVMTCT